MTTRFYHVGFVALTLGLALQGALADSGSSVVFFSFTPATSTATGVDRAKLSNSLLFYDTAPNHSDSATVTISSSLTSADFLLENGAYYLDFTLRLQNSQGVPPGLPVRLVTLSVLNPNSGLVDSTDSQYFLPGTGIESTSFFNEPPGVDAPLPEALSWNDGLLPAGDPFIEAVISATVRLDPSVSFENFRFSYRVDWQTVSNVPEAEVFLPLAAAAVGGLFWRCRCRR